jgi:hypothetical protein
MIPSSPVVSRAYLSVAAFGWLVSFPLVFLNFMGELHLTWANWLAAFFAVSMAATLALSPAQAEAQELKQQITTLLDELGSPAA